jgi:hypothetical protein
VEEGTHPKMKGKRRNKRDYDEEAAVKNDGPKIEGLSYRVLSFQELLVNW